MNRARTIGAALAVLVFCPLLGFAQPAGNGPKLPDNVELLRDVEYGTGGGRALKMHILRPKETTKTAMPVLVWIHGGGWMSGNKDSGIGLLAPYAARGYFCASVEYRLTNEKIKEKIFPAQIEDCKCAIRYLRAEAKEYHLDPEHIGVAGVSAGGHLVALLGTSGHVKELEGKGGWQDQSSRVQAVCDFCGPTDFFRIKDANSPIIPLFGGPTDEHKELAKLASPLTHVTKDAPPFLIVHGDKDNIVPLAHSELLRDALKKAGVDVTLYVAKGQGHNIGGLEVYTVVQAFFDKQLKPTGR